MRKFVMAGFFALGYFAGKRSLTGIATVNIISGVVGLMADRKRRIRPARVR
jgi:hypothetical protein